MGKYILEMLQGDDGKISSCKIQKIVCLLMGIAIFFIDAFNNGIDLFGYCGLFLGMALGQEMTQKITNAVGYGNNQGK